MLIRAGRRRARAGCGEQGLLVPAPARAKSQSRQVGRFAARVLAALLLAYGVGLGRGHSSDLVGDYTSSKDEEASLELRLAALRGHSLASSQGLHEGSGANATDIAFEEEAEVDGVSEAISVMLLGSIGFMMVLFYLTNANDRDIQRYSWQVISATISIFCAVLLFAAFNGLVEEYIIEIYKGSAWWEVSIDMFQLIFWLCVMQLVLAKASGAIGKAPASIEEVELNLQSWSVLFSHLAGFAALNAWGSLQQNFFFKENFYFAMLVVPIGLVGTLFMFWIFDQIRWKVSHADDGDLDEFEEKWDDEAEEAENDVAGLSLSFLTCQALRLLIGGYLPNQEGKEAESTAALHGGMEWKTLVLCGVAFTVLSIMFLRMSHGINKDESSFKEALFRYVMIFNLYGVCGTAWCFFYAAKWWLQALDFTKEESLLHVALALTLSALSFMFIFALDKIHDSKILGKQGGKALEDIIQALGILVGFSWEQSFDVAVDTITTALSSKCPAALSRVVLSMLLCVVVFPAWRNYILTTVSELNEEHELEEEAEEGGGEARASLRFQTSAKIHNKLVMDKETPERDIDQHHLILKQKKRRMLGEKERSWAKGLKHMVITATGIREMFEAESGEEGKDPMDTFEDNLCNDHDNHPVMAGHYKRLEEDE